MVSKKVTPKPNSSPKVKDITDINKKPMSTDDVKSILDNETSKRLQNITCRNFNYKKEYIYLHRFRTNYSKDIEYDLLIEAEETIDRKRGVAKLAKMIGYDYIAEDIEMGVYEFAMINVTINKFQKHLVRNIYDDKINDLCSNLDINDKRINNRTLLAGILNGSLEPFFLAFMSPDQLHPKRWVEIMNKIKLKDETLSNLQTTDLYKCKKCGERKFKISQMQLRSADEPMTTILTCLVCYNTFTKG